MDRLCAIAIVLLNFLCVSLVKGQYYEQSPCPNIFEYKYENNNVHGIIHLQPNGPVSLVRTSANFTLRGFLPTNYAGHIESVGSENQIIQNLQYGQPITLKVHFPVISPVPKLTSLSVNDNIICYGPGDIPGPNERVTTLSIHQTLVGVQTNGLASNPNAFNEIQPVMTDYNKNDGNSWINSLFNKNEFSSNTPQQSQPSFIQIYPQQPAQQPQMPTFMRPQPQQPQQNQPKPVQNRPVKTQPTAPPTQPYQPPTQPPTQMPIYNTQNTNNNRPANDRTTPNRVSNNDANIPCGLVAGGNDKVSLIFNGQSYSRGEWPWLVAIYKRFDGSLSFICSGTLVSNRHIVTAAHCIHQKTSLLSIKDIVIKVGVYNLEDWGDDIYETRTLSSATIHEAYNSSTLANDISIFTLDRTVSFNSNIRSACLWSGNTDLNRIVGASGVVAGWGRSELGPAGQGEPKMTRIPVVSTETCRASRPDFHKLTSHYTFCAGDRNGVGPCLGDSGGGMYILEDGRWRLRGVVSLSLRPDNGDGTCNLNEYIVFTDAAKYNKWISSIVGVYS